MLGRRDDILGSASFEPRAHLEGVDLPQGFRLPSLAAVRADSQRLPELKRTGPGEIHAVFMSSDGRSSTNGRPPPPLPEPLAWNTTLPSLFKFSYFADTRDVPVDLLEDVIFILKMFVRVLTESTEKQLRDIGHYLPHQKADVANYFMLSNTRYKLVTHLMNDKIDRPDEALPHFKDAAEQDLKRLRKTGSREDPRLRNPTLYSMYADALTFTSQFNKETKGMLEVVLKAATESAIVTAGDFSQAIAHAHINLSLVLQQMDIEPEKQKEHTEWAVKWVRKNAKRMKNLEQFLRRSNQPPHPVCVALGAEWFGTTAERGTTHKEDDRTSKRCRNCGLMEPQVKLFRCSACQHIFYCSRECQKVNWKHHKENCKETAKSKARAQELKNTDPKAGQKATDWIKWREGSHYANTYALAHALGLHRDPSRGRTHIVIRSLEYTPKVSKDFRYRFRVVSAGVFRMDDVWPEIEAFMDLEPGEGKEYVDGLLAELDSTDRIDKIPILDLSFGGGIETWLGSFAIPVPALRSDVYDPNWRKSTNMGDPAEPMVLRSGAQDVEHVF